MGASGRKIMVMAVVIFWVLNISLNFAVADAKKLRVRIWPTTIVSGVPFKLWLEVKNPHNVSISFNKATVAYAKPDLTYGDPVEYNPGPNTIGPGQSRWIALNSVTINTSQASGTTVVIFVSLFKDYISSDDDSFKGGAVGGLKIQ